MLNIDRKGGRGRGVKRAGSVRIKGGKGGDERYARYSMSRPGASPLTSINIYQLILTTGVSSTSTCIYIHRYVSKKFVQLLLKSTELSPKYCSNASVHCMLNGMSS